MRIGMFAPDIVIGGVTTFILALGSALKKAGHEVTVITCRGGGGAEQLAEAQLKYEIGRAHV